MDCGSNNTSARSPPHHQPAATLIDLHTDASYTCRIGKNIISSSILNLSASSSHNPVLISTQTPFIAELEVVGLNYCLITCIEGEIFVHTLQVHHQEKCLLCNKEILQIGLDTQLQLIINKTSFKIRKLPRDPLWGFKFTMEPILRAVSPSNFTLPSKLEQSLSGSYQMDIPLQNTLKRVSREINQRKTGCKDSKQPLPPAYERVGNSIAYQLLLQSHPKISEKLVTSMYPLLKELESTTSTMYVDYLETFGESLKINATPQCLHPCDMPTVRFIMDMCVHVAAMPADVKHHYVKPDPSIWMNLLSIFSSSQQNQITLVDYKCPTKVIGCMSLTSMADNIDLQCFSWEVLSNVITVATPTDNKPSVKIQIINVLLDHIKRQLEQSSHRADLIKAIFKFLTALTTTVRSCITSKQIDPERQLPYTQNYARDIFQLLEESKLRETLLDLPEYVQEYDEVASLLQMVLIALAPITTQASLLRKPPPKPKRNRRRTQLISESPSIEKMIPIQIFEIPHNTGMLRSSSTTNIIDRNFVSPTNNDVESSLPVAVGISCRQLPMATKTSQNVEMSLPASLHACTNTKPDNVTVTTNTPKRGVGGATGDRAPGPESLIHYNRVSLKRKNRSTYVKTVNASPQKNDDITMIPTEHDNIVSTLSERNELLTGIFELWKTDKVLQAASNCILACFFNETTDDDVPLFMDCLQGFCSNPKSWTIGVCVILLPYIRQVIITKQMISYMDTLLATLKLIVDQFSSPILNVKTKKKLSKADMEQKQACYHELHLLAATVNKMKPTGYEEMTKFHAILKQFVDPLTC